MEERGLAQWGVLTQWEEDHRGQCIAGSCVEGRSLEDKPFVWIGRRKDNDVVLPQERQVVSLKHCKVEVEFTTEHPEDAYGAANGRQKCARYFLHDMSSNGTFLNRSRIRVGKGNRVEISSRDVFRLTKVSKVASMDEKIYCFRFFTNEDWDAYIESGDHLWKTYNDNREAWGKHPANNKSSDSSPPNSLKRANSTSSKSSARSGQENVGPSNAKKPRFAQIDHADAAKSFVQSPEPTPKSKLAQKKITQSEQRYASSINNLLEIKSEENEMLKKQLAARDQTLEKMTVKAKSLTQSLQCAQKASKDAQLEFEKERASLRSDLTKEISRSAAQKFELQSSFDTQIDELKAENRELNNKCDRLADELENETAEKQLVAAEKDSIATELKCIKQQSANKDVAIANIQLYSAQSTNAKLEGKLVEAEQLIELLHSKLIKASKCLEEMRQAANVETDLAGRIAAFKAVVSQEIVSTVEEAKEGGDDVRQDDQDKYLIATQMHEIEDSDEEVEASSKNDKVESVERTADNKSPPVGVEESENEEQTGKNTDKDDEVTRPTTETLEGENAQMSKPTEQHNEGAQSERRTEPSSTEQDEPMKKKGSATLSDSESSSDDEESNVNQFITSASASMDEDC